ELLPPGMDVVKLPSYLAYDDEQGAVARPILSIDAGRLYNIREAMLTTFVREFNPHALLVDYYPQGKGGEATQAMERSHETRKVLGLRGILGTPEETNSQVFNEKTAAFIERYYSAIHVYIDEQVFRLEDYYAVPPSLQKLIAYTGYVTRSVVTARSEARSRLGIDEGARVIVASFGGGQGTGSLWSAILRGLEGIGHHYDAAYLAAGPYLEVEAYERLRRLAEEHANWTWTRLLDPLPVWMAASDLFIGSGGYNSLAEILATNANALVIPRQLQEREQVMHAERLARLGKIRVADLDGILLKNTANLLELCLREPYPGGALKIATDGALRSAALIKKLVS
ncbi:MAG TPA: glycosyltransferase, partial [Ktedonobacteraceae bacterium]|nr:glycosyltransferase [Ktedonobacteraceae bacterium]